MANSSSNSSSGSSSNSRSNGSQSTVANAKRSASNRGSRSSSGRSGSPRSSSSSRSSRGGSSSGRSSNSSFSLGRSVIGPIKRSNWTPYVLGAIGLGALIYGLSQISAVRSFVSPSSDLSSDLYGGSDISSMDDSMEFDEDVRVIGTELGSMNRSF